MNFYRVLRDNTESGPFSLDQLKKFGLKSSDLIWVDGESASWKFPDEVAGLIAKVEGNKNEDIEIPKVPIPKKRYRLTADHKMVEITDEEANSDIPRVAEQPPAPQIIEEKPIIPKVEPPITNPENAPFSKRIVPEDTDHSLDIEPELIEKAREKKPSGFVEFEPEKEEKSIENLEEYSDNTMKKNNNIGAFIFAGLLFVVAIGFFGYKYFADQQKADDNTVIDNVADTTSPDNTLEENRAVMNGSKIGIADDTIGTVERNLSKKQYRDSIEKARLNRLNTQTPKVAAKDTPDNAPADIALDEPSENTIAENAKKTVEDKPKTDTATHKTPQKVTIDPITGKSDLDNYVRIGVVNPPQKSGGVKGMKLVVHNVSKRNIARVRINVLYFNQAGLIVKRKSIVAPNITIGNSVTMPVEDDASANLVSYKIAGILGDHVNLQR